MEVLLTFQMKGFLGNKIDIYIYIYIYIYEVLEMQS